MKVKKKKKTNSIDNLTNLMLTTQYGGKNRWMCDLPMPSRLILQQVFDAYDERMGKSKELFYKLYKDETYHSNAIWLEACASCEDGVNFANSIIQSINTCIAAYGQVAQGDSFKFHLVMPHRYHTCNGKFFSLTHSVNQMLQETDMVAKCPASYLKLPYRNIFIDCGIEREVPFRLHHDVSGAHILEGAYLTEVYHPGKVGVNFTKNCNEKWKEYGYQSPLIHRSIEILLCGSPKYKKHFEDDCYFSFSIHISDEEENIDALINREIEIYRQQFKSRNTVEVNDLLESVSHILKAVLLLNTKNCDLIEKNHKDDLLRDIKKQSIKHKKRALIEERKYTNNTIYIDLSEKDKEFYQQNLAGRSTPKTHWRRGHFRMLKANPPTRMEPKPTWVRPCIVNSSGNDGSIKNKSYAIDI